MTIAKIKPLEELALLIAGHRSHGRKVVHCHGCFDLVHYGHLKHFETAKQQGDLLVVTVTEDHYVNKGSGRPFFTLSQRCEYLAALEVIDFVGANRWPSAAPTIRLLAPSIYIKGIEYKHMPEDIKLQEEIAAVESVGGHIHFTDDIVFSSTYLLNKGLIPELAATGGCQ